MLSFAAIAVAALGVVYFDGLSAGLVGLVAVVMALSALNLVALGIVGAYVWRALDQARGRPLYLIERTVGAVHSDPTLVP